MWTFWAMSVAVFTFPIQHWIIRTFQVDQGEGGVRRALPQLVVLTIAGAAVLTALAVVLRARFFGSPTPVWPVLVMLVTAGSAVTGYLRGVLSGRRRFVATGVAIAADAVVRLLACSLVVVLGGSVAWFAAAIAVGPVILLIWPSVLTLCPDGSGSTAPVAGFLGGLAGGVLLSQIALSAGPAVLAAVGGAPAEVTALFATMALFRAPYLIALGLASRGTGPLTRLVASGSESRLGRLRRGVAVVGLAGALVGGLLGWWIGPALVDLVFGTRVAPAASVAGIARGDDGIWRLDGEAPVAASHVVVAVAPHQAAPLLGEDLAAGLFPGARAAPVAVVALGGRGDPLPPGFGYLVAPGAGELVVGCLFESSYAPERAPAGHWLAKVIVGGACRPEAVDQDDATLIAGVLGELGAALGGEPDPELAHVVRHRPGIPQYEVGHAAVVAALAAAVATRPGLHLTGWAYRGVGVTNLATDAVRVADAIVAAR
jgi:hypothetical protein